MALHGIEQIRIAAASLQVRDVLLRAALASAGAQFCRAAIRCELWPAGFQKRADRVTRQLMKRGAIAPSLALLDEKAVRALRDEILAFARAAERN